MTVREEIEDLPIFDNEILAHGFSRNMRDYELMVEGSPFDGSNCHLVVFTHCVVATCQTRIVDEVVSQSWEDHYTDLERWKEAGAPAGFVWGVRSAAAYPGVTYHADSALTREWTERLGREMHEVSIETNVWFLRLVFHSVKIQDAPSDAETPRVRT